MAYRHFKLFFFRPRPSTYTDPFRQNESLCRAVGCELDHNLYRKPKTENNGQIHSATEAAKVGRVRQKEENVSVNQRNKNLHSFFMFIVQFCQISFSVEVANVSANQTLGRLLLRDWPEQKKNFVNDAAGVLCIQSSFVKFRSWKQFKRSRKNANKLTTDVRLNTKKVEKE